MKEHLRTYLRDHLAGAAFGVELAQRAAQSNAGTEYGEPLSRLAEEIEFDRERLISIVDSLDIGRDLVKESIAWAGEKVARLKLNNRLLGYSPLSRLVEIEGLLLGVSGKLALFELLQAVRADYPELAAADIPQLIERAQIQRSLLEELRLTAGVAALSAAPESEAFAA
jgi:hypothetical protein